jgi:hypothetical protein
MILHLKSVAFLFLLSRGSVKKQRANNSKASSPTARKSISLPEKLTLVMDATLVELFADGGLTVMT